MKKIIAVNCSPRQTGNTAQLLNSVIAGAVENGGDAKIIHLADIAFSGCRSCFSCKRQNAPEYGICSFQDGLTPILREILTTCDGLVIGTPVYFSAESGLCRNFIERLFFPVLSYDDFSISLAPRKLPIAFIYTMNVTEEMAKNWHYPEKFRLLQEYAANMFDDGHAMSIYSYDTRQFDDYAKYHAATFDLKRKAESRNVNFINDLAKARELGHKLASE